MPLQPLSEPKRATHTTSGEEKKVKIFMRHYFQRRQSSCLYLYRIAHTTRNEQLQAFHIFHIYQWNIHMRRDINFPMRKVSLERAIRSFFPWDFSCEGKKFIFKSLFISAKVQRYNSQWKLCQFLFSLAFRMNETFAFALISDINSSWNFI